jgi:hypothetical protein
MMTQTEKSKRTRKPKAEAPIAFQHDALVIRTVAPDDTAFGGFQWPSKIGELVECPDWNPAPRCGNGFHGLLDGIGDWGLTWRDEGMVWQVAGVIRAECVAVGEDKVKFPRCRLLYRGDKNGALAQIIPALVKAIQGTADAKLASGRGEIAAATGDRGHAAATGDSGHAAATGYRGHAAATGKSAIAASLGIEGTATAGPSGAIVLAYYEPRNWTLQRVGAFMVGQDGIEPGKTYRLGADGKPVQA